MRTSQASSLISRIVPSGNMTLSGILLLGIVFMCLAISWRHEKAIKKISLNGIIMIALGVVILCMAGAATRDAEKYTHGTKRTTATVAYVEEEYRADESNDYTYTIEFTYKNQPVSVRMYPTHRMGLEQGDPIAVYFYPEQIGKTDYPAVVAVDLEKKQARDNMSVGFLSCFIGLSLMFYASSKQALLKNGFHVSATVIQVAVRSSKSDNGRTSIEKTLICQGRNPATRMLQTFRTHGTGTDFLAYSEGDVVHVFVHQKRSKFYIINI